MSFESEVKQARKTLADIAKERKLKAEELLIIERNAARNMGLFDFCKVILGYKDLIEIHKDLCRFLEEGASKKLILMPRYSFKSTICSVGYPLWCLVRDPNLRFLIYSDASSKAQGFLTSIKSHCEGKVENSFLSALFNWASDGRETKWNESQIVIKDRKVAYPEPSIDTGGIETSKVGLHFDILIFDDLVSDKNVTTKEQMDKTLECYQRSLSLLKPDGKVLLVGTRWSFGDLYGRIVAENEFKKNFKIFIVDGEEDKIYGKWCFSSIGLTQDFLEGQKREQGSYVYSALYRNNPVDPETAVFRVRDFSFYGRGVKPEDLYITGTCDPAGEGEDFTAISVLGTDCNMDAYILDLVNKHLQPSEIIDEIIRLHRKYKFKIFGLEMNFFRGMLKMELDRRMREETINDHSFQLFGVEEFEATSRRGQSKTNRIMALQPYHERGALKFPGESFDLLDGDFAVLAHQMIQFPRSEHDDLIDSLAYHLPLLRKGGVVKKVELPRGSAAWFERKSMEEELKRNGRLPRRFRRFVDTRLAFS